MNEEELLHAWVNYGIVCRIPFNEIPKIKEFFKDSGYKVIFDKVSLNHIILQEEFPSGNPEYEEE